MYIRYEERNKFSLVKEWKIYITRYSWWQTNLLRIPRGFVHIYMYQSQSKHSYPASRIGKRRS